MAFKWNRQWRSAFYHRCQSGCSLCQLSYFLIISFPSERTHPPVLLQISSLFAANFTVNDLSQLIGLRESFNRPYNKLQSLNFKSVRPDSCSCLHLPYVLWISLQNFDLDFWFKSYFTFNVLFLAICRKTNIRPILWPINLRFQFVISLAALTSLYKFVSFNGCHGKFVEFVFQTDIQSHPVWGFFFVYLSTASWNV